MFFRRNREETVICEGAVFRRCDNGDKRETATVEWVGKGPFGLTHVRFRLRVNDIQDMDDSRILSVDAFRARFGGHLPANAA